MFTLRQKFNFDVVKKNYSTFIEIDRNNYPYFLSLIKSNKIIEINNQEEKNLIKINENYYQLNNSGKTNHVIPNQINHVSLHNVSSEEFIDLLNKQIQYEKQWEIEKLNFFRYKTIMEYIHIDQLKNEMQMEKDSFLFYLISTLRERIEVMKKGKRAINKSTSIEKLFNNKQESNEMYLKILFSFLYTIQKEKKEKKKVSCQHLYKNIGTQIIYFFLEKNKKAINQLITDIPMDKTIRNTVLEYMSDDFYWNANDNIDVVIMSLGELITTACVVTLEKSNITYKKNKNNKEKLISLPVVFLRKETLEEDREINFKFVITDKILYLINHYYTVDNLDIDKIPMICKPLNWESNILGGYLHNTKQERNKWEIECNSEKIKEIFRYKNPTSALFEYGSEIEIYEKMFQSINILQNTAYTMNYDLFDKLKKNIYFFDSQKYLRINKLRLNQIMETKKDIRDQMELNNKKLEYYHILRKENSLCKKSYDLRMKEMLYKILSDFTEPAYEIKYNIKADSIIHIMKSIDATSKKLEQAMEILVNLFDEKSPFLHEINTIMLNQTKYLYGGWNAFGYICSFYMKQVKKIDVDHEDLKLRNEVSLEEILFNILKVFKILSDDRDIVKEIDWHSLNSIIKKQLITFFTYYICMLTVFQKRKEYLFYTYERYLSLNNDLKEYQQNYTWVEYTKEKCIDLYNKNIFFYTWKIDQRGRMYMVGSPSPMDSKKMRTIINPYYPKNYTEKTIKNIESYMKTKLNIENNKNVEVPENFSEIIINAVQKSEINKKDLNISINQFINILPFSYQYYMDQKMNYKNGCSLVCEIDIANSGFLIAALVTKDKELLNLVCRENINMDMYTFISNEINHSDVFIDFKKQLNVPNCKVNGELVKKIMVSLIYGANTDTIKDHFKQMIFHQKTMREKEKCMLINYADKFFNIILNIINKITKNVFSDNNYIDRRLEYLKAYRIWMANVEFNTRDHLKYKMLKYYIPKSIKKCKYNERESLNEVGSSISLFAHYISHVEAVVRRETILKIYNRIENQMFKNENINTNNYFLYTMHDCIVCDIALREDVISCFKEALIETCVKNSPLVSFLNDNFESPLSDAILDDYGYYEYQYEKKWFPLEIEEIIRNSPYLLF